MVLYLSLYGPVWIIIILWFIFSMERVECDECKSLYYVVQFKLPYILMFSFAGWLIWSFCESVLGCGYIVVVCVCSCSLTLTLHTNSATSTRSQSQTCLFLPPDSQVHHHHAPLLEFSQLSHSLCALFSTLTINILKICCEDLRHCSASWSELN